jgi:hypothetical protein
MLCFLAVNEARIIEKTWRAVFGLEEQIFGANKQVQGAEVSD